MTEQEKRDWVIEGLKCVAETYKFYLHDLATEAVDLLKAQEPVDAIPVEWLREKMRGYASSLKSTETAALVMVMQMWQKEQEAQK